MIHTFATREEAAVFAAAMRSEGRFAEILDEGMGAIYGPLAIGGIRVMVSEEADDGEHLQMLETPADEKPSAMEECLNVFRLFVVSLVACGLIALIIFMLKTSSDDPWLVRQALYPLLKYLLITGCLFALMGPLMGGFTRWLRGDCTSIGSRSLRWLFVALVTLFVLLLML